MLEDGKELMFDKDSFKEEITSKEEAEACYKYFTHNLTAFRSQLANKGLSHDEVEGTIRQCWLNLIQSCQKAGYKNNHLDRMKKLYSTSEAGN